MASQYPYQKTISNTHLGVSKTIKAKTSVELDNKVKEQMEKWKIQVGKLKSKNKEEKDLLKAEALTNEADQLINEYRNLLINSAKITHEVNWDNLLIKKEFEPFIFNDVAPKLEEYFKKHKVPGTSFWEDLLPFIKNSRLKIEEAARLDYEREYSLYRERKEKLYQKYLEEQSIFEAGKNSHNESILKIKNGLIEGDKQAICEHCDLVIRRAPLPNDFNPKFEINYIEQMKTLIVDYTLPTPDRMPRVIEYKYIKTKKEIAEKLMNQKEFDSFYDNVIYQLSLKTIHELFSSDTQNNINTIVFNGIVHGTSPATGNYFTSCIITQSVEKEDYQPLNLERVNPKECFRKLKGLSIGALKDMAPVKPFMEFTKNEKRFVESKDILIGVENIPNISKMPWEDFEHLVRGLFERMFSINGSEVRTTKASRDGGVDVIVYDPDPIRGGVFVVQAKRYNNVVPVSAVRDLYGTMINEGAVKGLLVTTSYFGNDSHKFVKDKPITLIDGSYLMELFQKHGYTVKIANE
ncbi:restriction endonuclease [Neobacillus sp. PS2-9]|uniref:restriction endonuclease n=1 Tax=Neobacillus sp. PS2-9 TaxID=3070676 RepID=UPI0027DEE8F0|nr:restriction endonuclease [Neobacillus sp. PS2-9]WML56500.1 restriction endonuclease [Neobacillus sp. PS2-9]